MLVSPRFSDHIKSIEGFRDMPYRDTGGRLTIGYGHVIKHSEGWLKEGVISQAVALQLLHQDAKGAENAVNAYVKVPLNQDQFDALVSFVFNVGNEAFRTSTLLRKLNAGRCCAVPDELRRWKYDGKHIVAGLAARREKEIALYVGDA